MAAAAFELWALDTAPPRVPSVCGRRKDTGLGSQRLLRRRNGEQNGPLGRSWGRYPPAWGSHDHVQPWGRKICPTHPAVAVLGVRDPPTGGCRAAPHLPSRLWAGGWGVTRHFIPSGP